MIYVHVPFCRSFCTYCDFYSEAVCKGQDASAFALWAESLRNEIVSRTDEIKETYGVNTLYIGGGTPSVLPLDVLSGVLSSLPEHERWTEFTVEVNPEDIVERGVSYARELLDLGVTRISMGVQSFDDSVLHWMNRRHNAAGARRAFELLREAGARNISLDLIFGLGQEHDSTLEATLEKMIALHPEHISAYQLSIEEGSALGKMHAEGRFDLPSDEACAAQYALICRELSLAGYEHYEISNWALPGYRAVHNSAYWTRAPYVGLGPGAHSLSGSGLIRSSNSPTSSAWQSTGEILSAEEIHEEQIMLSLRTCEGMEASLLPDGKCRSFLREGLLEKTNNGYVRIPEGRMFVSDSIISELI